MLISCGDALIDCVPVELPDGRNGFVPVVGGSCLNVAIAMSRLGAPTAFLGGISTDMFGEMITAHLQASHVSLAFTERSARETTLAFVHFAAGEAHYSFYDETTAARLWTYRSGSIPFHQVDALHSGSTTLVNEPSSTATLALFQEAKGLTTLSFDPNCRPNLVHDLAAYRARMDEFARLADIIRMSDADFRFLFDHENFDRIAETYLQSGSHLFIITEGGEGATAWHKAAGKIRINAPPIVLVDTIGAGDTFQGALLTRLREGGYLSADTLAELQPHAVHDALNFAVTAAAITCTRAGANPPWRHEMQG